MHTLISRTTRSSSAVDPLVRADTSQFGLKEDSNIQRCLTRTLHPITLLSLRISLTRYLIKTEPFICICKLWQKTNSSMSTQQCPVFNFLDKFGPHVLFRGPGTSMKLLSLFHTINPSLLPKETISSTTTTYQSRKDRMKRPSSH